MERRARCAFVDDGGPCGDAAAFLGGAERFPVCSGHTAPLVDFLVSQHGRACLVASAGAQVERVWILVRTEDGRETLADLRAARRDAAECVRGALGEGDVYRRKDGRFVAALAFPDGTRRTRYGRTDAEARALLRQLHAERERGEAARDGRRTVKEFCDRWMEDVVRVRLAVRTYDCYKQRLRDLIYPHIGPMRLAKVRPADIQRVLAAATARGLSNGSVNGIRTTLGSAFARAERWELIPRNPVALTDPLPAKPVARKRVIRPEEVTALIDALEGHRDGALFLTLLTTGARLGEALGLRWEDVDFEARTIHLRGQLQHRKETGFNLVPIKRTGKPRSVPLLEPALEPLRRHRRAQRERRLAAGAAWANDWDLAFTRADGGPLQQFVVWKRWADVLREAGLEHARIHDLRRGVGSYLARLGVPPRTAAEWLGHARISTTLEFYTESFPDAQRDAAVKLEGLFSSRMLSDKLSNGPQEPRDKEGTV
jgi:integrase